VKSFLFACRRIVFPSSELQQLVLVVFEAFHFDGYCNATRNGSYNYDNSSPKLLSEHVNKFLKEQSTSEKSH
jgi:hypothetical protein